MIALALVIVMAAQSSLTKLALAAASASPTSASPTAAAAQLPSHGGAFVTTLPLGADVWVDGAYVGRTPAFVDLLSAGKHTLVLTRTGWAAQSATVQIGVGQIVPISLLLARATAAAINRSFGTLDVRGSPAGASVYVDGEKLGGLPVTGRKVRAGYHIITVVGARTERSTRDVNVFPDTATTVSITAGEPGGPAGDILEPVSSYLPAQDVSVHAGQVVIKHRGAEVRCALGSRTYTLNGKEGLLSMAPAMLSGKLYLPLSLLQHITGTPR